MRPVVSSPVSVVPRRPTPHCPRPCGAPASAELGWLSQWGRKTRRVWIPATLGCSSGR